MSEAEIPIATYRLQFRQGMNFRKAARLAPYLSRLGVSHLYASPIFAAASGSTHGYDVTDHNEIDASLGGREGFEEMSRALKSEGLKLLLDIVPNHMAASVENPWWRSVIQWGSTSPFAGHFDIDWSERLTLPILGQPFEDAVRSGDVSLAIDGKAGCIAMAVPGSLLPLAPSSYRTALEGLEGDVVHRIANLARQALPLNEREFSDAFRKALAKDGGEELAEMLERRSRTNGVLELVHASQPWRLLHWKEGRRHLSYRRFFEVTGLAGVRVEVPEVFDDVHRLTLELLGQGLVDGLRIDHVDGLADPASYLHRLREAVGPDVYIVVEKILGANEKLPADWPVDGTTGYEFITSLADLLVDPAGYAAMAEACAEHMGRWPQPAEELRSVKMQILTHNFEGELGGLAGTLGEEQGADAIAEIIASFDVYRTYGGIAGFSDEDERRLSAAAGEAAERRPVLRDAIEAVTALLRQAGQVDEEGEADPEAVRFRARFQQLSGPVMAKSVEDTFFYRYHPFIAMNEVGAEPATAPRGLKAFHAAMADRAGTQPHGLSATATHDTKRGEDARARLYALSEYPGDWKSAVSRWRNWLDPVGLEPEIEWMIYQALAGVWPAASIAGDKHELEQLTQRVLAFIEKALREAKLKTSWTDPDEAYEAAAQDFVRQLLSRENQRFQKDFEQTLQPVIEAGATKALCQTLIKLMAPGVPDIYQGSEDADLSLVDPDNRRPPDFERLEEQLTETSGPAKQRLIAAALGLRAQDPELFSDGRYLALEAEGAWKDHVVAFARIHKGRWAIAAGIRLPLALRNKSIDGAPTVALGKAAPKAFRLIYPQGAGPDVSAGRLDFGGSLGLGSPVVIMSGQA